MAYDDKLNALPTAFVDRTVSPFSVDEVVGLNGIGWGESKVIPSNGVVPCEFALIGGAKTVTVDAVSYTENTSIVPNGESLETLQGSLGENEYFVDYRSNNLVFSTSDATKTISECTHDSYGQAVRGNDVTDITAAVKDVVNEFKLRMVWEAATVEDLTTNYPPEDYKIGIANGELYVSDGVQWVKQSGVGFKLNSSTPANNGTMWNINNLSLAFSQNVDGTTVNSTNITFKDKNNATVAATYSVSNNVVTINPDSDLNTANNPFTVTVTTNVKNTIGEALGTQVVISFNALAETAIIQQTTTSASGTGVKEQAGDNSYVAQSFQHNANMNISAVELYGCTYPAGGAMANTIVEICANNAGKPGTVLGSLEFDPNDYPIFTTWAWHKYSFASQISLTANTTYWLKLRPKTATTGLDVFTWNVSSTDVYASGSAVRSTDLGVTWPALSPAKDFVFKIYGLV